MLFEKIIEIILKLEGGFTIDPTDPGGATNFGISSRAYPALDIQALTKDQAVQIYKTDYWDKYKLQYMPGLCRLAIFDACVNHGPTKTIKMIQVILNQADDGMIGQETLLALSAVNAQQFLETFCKARFQVYSQNPNFGRFGVGWSKRLLEIIFRSFDME